MQIVSTRHSSPRQFNELHIPAESGRTGESQELSLHELAVRICIEALVGGSHPPEPSLRIPDHFTCGNTLVLTLGGTVIWTSHHDATLPHELFGSAPHDVSGGIYARHVTHKQQLYHILATRLSWVALAELCLHSVASSESSHDDIAFERLAFLAHELRAMAPSIAEHCESLREHLTSNQPSLFVTCDSGTVVLASLTFLQLWQMKATPVGMRFTELMENHWHGATNQLSTRLIHLSGNSCPVTIVTFVSNTVERNFETDPTAFLIHNLRNKIASILTASSYLAMHNDSFSSKERETIDIVASSADQFDRTLSQLEALTTPSQEKQQLIEIGSVLAAAIDRVTSISKESHVSISDTASGQISCSPRDMTTLSEAILLSHGHPNARGLSTVIDGSTHNGQLRTSFRTTGTPQTAANRTSKIWKAYVDTVAEKAGIVITHESRNGGTIQLTSIENNTVTP